MERVTLLLVLWAAVYAYLALQGPKVMDVLVYDESKLVPRDLEPLVVERAVPERNITVPIIVEGPDLLNRVRNVTMRLAGSGYSVISAWTIYSKAVEEHRNAVESIVANITGNLTKVLVGVAEGTNRTCRDLLNLSLTYAEVESRVRSILRATYGLAAAGRAPNGSERARAFLEAYRKYLARMDPDSAVRAAARDVYGDAAALLEGATWYNWASNATVRAIARRVMGELANASLLDVVEGIGAPTWEAVRRYVYLESLGAVGDELRPYLAYFVCPDNATLRRGLELVGAEVRAEVLEEFPPPTFWEVGLRSGLLTARYGLVLASTDGTLYFDSGYARAITTEALLAELRSVTTEDISKIDRTTALALLAILVLVMGTLLAPVLVIALIGTTYMALLGLMYLTSGLLRPYYLSAYMAAPIVFGIGVDYSLLVIGRYLEERANGEPPKNAAVRAARLTRRTVLSCGAVVLVALGSFALSPLEFMQSIGAAYVYAVALTMGTVLVALPSLLAVIGDRAFWPVRPTDVSVHGGRARLLVSMARVAMRRPYVVMAISAAGTALSLAFVLAETHVTTNPVVALPEGDVKRGLEVILEEFEGMGLSETYILLRGDPPGPLIDAVESLPYYLEHDVERVNATHTLITVRLRLDELADQQLDVYRALDDARRELSLDMYIGGSASWKNVIYNNIFVGFWSFQSFVIVGAVVAVLVAMLRSVTIPLRLVATVLMSVVWALALTVLVFQGVLGKPTYWLLPIILFSLLISVGTDYDIFLVARIREEVQRGADIGEAVESAVRTTGPIITGAAAVLASAFATLGLSKILILQEVGVAVVAAVLIDAFVMRTFLVPAVLVLLRKWNWWPWNA